MNTFVPITSTWTDPTGAVIAIGKARIPSIKGEKSNAAALEPLWQMSQAAFAGEAEVELIDGEIQVKARISQDVAAAKTTRGVYRGFSLALLAGGDGSTRIARVALCDAPDAAIGKSALLKIGKAPAMNSSPILCSDREVGLMVRQARERRGEELRLSKAAAMNPDSVLGSIRTALARPFKEDAGLVSMLSGRRS